MQYSGKIITTADYGATYSIPDTDGRYSSFLFFYNSIYNNNFKNNDCL